MHNTQIHRTDKRLTWSTTDGTEVLTNREREQDRAVDHSTDFHAVGVSFNDDVLIVNII